MVHFSCQDQKLALTMTCTKTECYLNVPLIRRGENGHKHPQGLWDAINCFDTNLHAFIKNNQP